MNQDAVVTDFDDEGFSATVKFTSMEEREGSMTTYLVRGMVSKQTAARSTHFPASSSCAIPILARGTRFLSRVTTTESVCGYIQCTFCRITSILEHSRRNAVRRSEMAWLARPLCADSTQLLVMIALESKEARQRRRSPLKLYPETNVHRFAYRTVVCVEGLSLLMSYPAVFPSLIRFTGVRDGSVQRLHPGGGHATRYNQHQRQRETHVFISLPFVFGVVRRQSGWWAVPSLNALLHRQNHSNTAGTNPAFWCLNVNRPLRRASTPTAVDTSCWNSTMAARGYYTPATRSLNSRTSLLRPTSPAREYRPPLAI